MGNIATFQDILAWKKAHKLALLVYKITDSFPRCEEFGLKSQIRRAAVSIPSNIAEGFKRKSKADSVHFYNIAEASLEEVKYQLLLSRDLKYISDCDHKNIDDLANEVGKMLFGWLKSQRIYI